MIKAGRSIYPRTLERDLARRLKRRLRAASKLLYTELTRLLTNRQDSVSDELGGVQRTISRVRIAYFEQYTVVEDMELATEVEGKVEGYISRQVARQYKSVLGVDPLPTHKSQLQAQEFIAESVQKLRSIGEGFFDKLEAEIYEAYSSGARHEQLGRVIRKQYGVSARRAELIARDQIGTINAQINESKQTELGVNQYVWRNSQDERVVGNPSGKYPEPNEIHGNHWHREGVVFDWSTPPHDGHPGEAINCRCTAEPVWEWDEESLKENRAEEKHLRL